MDNYDVDYSNDPMTVGDLFSAIAGISGEIEVEVVYDGCARTGIFKVVLERDKDTLKDTCLLMGY